MWDLSCVDWEDLIRDGKSLVPDLPLFEDRAAIATDFYNEMRLPDVPGTPKLIDASGQWFRDIVRAVFGSWDAENGVRLIRDIFALAPKGSSKTSYSAALMLVAMLMNKRPRAEALFVGPTQDISDRAFDQAAGMVQLSPVLSSRFVVRSHIKTIEDLKNESEMKVKTFGLDVLTGAMSLIMVLVDELHVLGRKDYATKVMRQIRGGLDKTPEGVLLITTTQSDDRPQGAFKAELKLARNIRDGHYRGKIIRPMLPILYEFPKAIAADAERWQDQTNWPMVIPNLGKSVHLATMVADWNSESEKGDDAVRIWASQYLNIEIGIGINNDGWSGADLWETRADATLNLETLIRRSEVVTIGIDGGGRDDLLGFAIVGRERGTRKWLSWCKAWADPIVLERRKEIAPALHDFEDDGDLSICPVPDDLVELEAILSILVASGLLPIKNAVGLDPNNAAAVIDALTRSGITAEQIRRLLQGPALSPANYGLDRKLGDGTFAHAAQGLMDWCVANAKTEQRSSQVMVTKQVSGRSKIDPLVALFQAAMLMAWDPVAGELLTSDDVFTVI